MSKYWDALPDKIRAALIASAILIIGAVTDHALDWINGLGDVTDIGAIMPLLGFWGTDGGCSWICYTGIK